MSHTGFAEQMGTRILNVMENITSDILNQWQLENHLRNVLGFHSIFLNQTSQPFREKSDLEESLNCYAKTQDYTSCHYCHTQKYRVYQK